MENRFKFRCWDAENKSMFEDVSPRYYNDPWCVFMLCTGLVDINGKLIYDGDYVRIEIESTDEVRGQVIWGDGTFAFAVCIVKNRVAIALNSGFKYKIIGNDYENPELLNRKSGG